MKQGEVKTILFFMIPYWGHVNPHINLLSALQKQGFRVICFCSPQFSPLFNELGVKMYPYCDELLSNYQPSERNLNNSKYNQEKKETFASLEYNRERMSSLVYSNELIVKTAYESLIDISQEWNPGLVLYDSYAHWGMLIAKKLKIPCFCMESATVMDIEEEIFRTYIEQILAPKKDFNWEIEDYILFQKKLDRQYERNLKICAGLGRRDVLRPKRTFVYETEAFHKAYANKNADVTCVGYSQKDDIVIPDRRQGIFVTRGTMNHAVEIELFCTIIQLLNGYEGQVLATLGDKKQRLSFVKEKIKHASNIEIVDFADQIEELCKHELFLCHGGITGIREAIMCETPIIVIPSNYHCYQVGKTVEQLKIGILITEADLNKASLSAAIKEIFKDDSYKKNVITLKQTMIETNRRGEITEYINNCF